VIAVNTATQQLLAHTAISLSLIGAGVALLVTGNISSGEGIGLIAAGAGLGGAGTLSGAIVGKGGSGGS